MKSSHDPRHQRRRKVVQELFALSFYPQPSKQPLTQQIRGELEAIDEIISQAAPAFPLAKINKIDLAILRLAVSELISKKTPPKVVIDEAVELAKEFGGETSFSFVNGVLGTILKNI